MNIPWRLDVTFEWEFNYGIEWFNLSSSQKRMRPGVKTLLKPRELHPTWKIDFTLKIWNTVVKNYFAVCPLITTMNSVPLVGSSRRPGESPVQLKWLHLTILDRDGISSPGWINHPDWTRFRQKLPEFSSKFNATSKSAANCIMALICGKYS
jgi:hypothetical protein